jgi:hypothetical protein
LEKDHEVRKEHEQSPSDTETRENLNELIENGDEEIRNDEIDPNEMPDILNS